MRKNEILIPEWVEMAQGGDAQTVNYILICSENVNCQTRVRRLGCVFGL